MKKRFAMVSSWIGNWSVLLILLCVCLGFQRGAFCSGPPAENTKEETIRFRAISNDDYAVFPVNWSPEHRYRMGLIRSVKEYEEIFNSAAFAGNKKPYAPASKAFDDEMIIFVCKVSPAVADLDKELRLDKIVAKGDTLEVRFANRNTIKKSSYQIKVTAAAWIPKQDYKSIKYFDGANLVKEIKIDQKQWVFPE